MGLLDLIFGKNNNNNNNNSVHREVFSSVSVLCTKVDVTSDIVNSMKKKFIAFDVETTGLSANSDRIIELGAVLFENGTPTKHFGSLVNAGIPVPQAASRVNHITTEMLKKAPTEREIYSRFVEFIYEAINGGCVMCAHNASFDFGFLKNTFMRLGISANIKYVDTLAEARKYIKGLENYKQDTVAASMGLTNLNAHRAEADAEICGRILWNILEQAAESGMKTSSKSSNIYTVKPENIPNEEEKEVCAMVKSILVNACKDVSYLRFYKNSSGYIDCSCLYTFLKIKYTKKGIYGILPVDFAGESDCPQEDCTVSEGGADYKRCYFTNPKTIEKFSKYIVSEYAKTYKSMNTYLRECGSAAENVNQYLMLQTEITDDAMNTIISAISQKTYSEIDLSLFAKQKVSRADVVVNAVHDRCPLSEIENLNNSNKGFDAGFPFWEEGEARRKNGEIEKAISLYDIARKRGYCSPALYESYAMAYSKQKDYENVIVLMEECLSREECGFGNIRARLDKAIELLYKKQESDRLYAEKKVARELKKQEQLEQISNKQPKERGKKILQMDDDGNIIKEFDSVTLASDEVGVSTKCIRDAVLGKQKHAGGYCWKYIE